MKMLLYAFVDFYGSYLKFFILFVKQRSTARVLRFSGRVKQKSCTGKLFLQSVIVVHTEKATYTIKIKA